MGRKRKKNYRVKKQSGGLLKGPSHAHGGIPAKIQNGGMVELEGGEYIINAQTVNAVGTKYLDKLNSTATTHHQGGFQSGQIGNGSLYRKGGNIKKRKYQTGGGLNNPIIQTNLQAQQGQFMYKQSRRPYTGPYHMHQDGTLMIGAGKMHALHAIKPQEVIVRSNNSRLNNQSSQRRYQTGGLVNERNTSMVKNNRQRWVYYGTVDEYRGNVIKIGNDWCTTTDGTIEGNRRKIEPKRN